MPRDRRIVETSNTMRGPDASLEDAVTGTEEILRLAAELYAESRPARSALPPIRRFGGQAALPAGSQPWTSGRSSAHSSSWPRSSAFRGSALGGSCDHGDRNLLGIDFGALSATHTRAAGRLNGRPVACRSGSRPGPQQRTGVAPPGTGARNPPDAADCHQPRRNLSCAYQFGVERL